MVHVSRLGAIEVIGAMVWVAVASGCGSEAPASGAPPDETPDEAATGAEDESATEGDAFDVTFTGQSIPMNARAELRVNEGERDVHLWITGRTDGTDVILIDLTFDGLENTFGSHSLELSLPEGGPHDANGSLGGAWYYSQSGQVELRLSTDGRLEGHFEIALARAEETQPAELFEFKPSADSAPLIGSFSVPWVLSCHSRLAGHGILQPGGDYCDEIGLDP